MDELVLTVPNKEHEQQAREFVKEFLDYNSKMHGTGSLEEYIDNYDGWLEKIENSAKGINLKEGYAPASTYFVVRESDNKIVGMVNIRHELTERLLIHGGHIGDCIRPTERRKRYATEALFFALKKCHELGIERVLVTCDKNNIGSVKQIQNNFGILENEVKEDDMLFQRYWIDVEYAISNKRVR